MDRYFECIRDSLPEELNLNTTVTNYYVPYIEHKNRVNKEFARALIRTFKFKKVPGRYIIELVWLVGLWLNQEPSENGVSDVYSLQNIIMIQDLDYDNHCKFISRSYVESHEYYKINNDMEERIVGGIFMVPTANFQGRYKKNLKRRGAWLHASRKYEKSQY